MSENKTENSKPDITDDAYEAIAKLRVPEKLMQKYVSGDATLAESALVQSMQASQQLAYAMIASGAAAAVTGDQRLEYLLRAIELVRDAGPCLHAAAANTLNSDDDDALEKLLEERRSKRAAKWLAEWRASAEAVL